MAPFTYATFDNPHAGTIAQLLARAGDPAAAAAQSIGQTVSAIPGQMQQQNRAAVVDQAAQLQLDEAKRANKSRLVFEAELGNPANYNPDGTVNDAAVSARLKKQDVGAWQQWSTIAAANQKNALDLKKLQQDLEGSALSLEEKRRTLAQAQASSIGKLALSAESVLQQDPENPQHARDTLLSALGFGAAHGWIDAETARATAAKFQTAQPAEIAGMLQQFITPELREAHAKEAADLAKTTAEAAKANAEAENLKKYGSPTPPSFEQKNVTLDGKPDQLVNFNPRTGQMFLPGSDQPIEASRIRGNTPASIVIHNAGGPAVPGDFDKTGDAFLATIPASARAIVKKIANYELDPTKVTAMRSNRREEIMEWATQVNPEYDQANFAIRNPTRKAFTVGTQGQQINAINTALGHIHQLTTVSERLENGGFTPANEAWNSIRTVFGSDKVTNFDTLKDALSGEVASVLSKSGATVSGIAEAKEKIKAANSPTQLAGYVTTLIPVMGSKLAELNFQYHQAMGANDPFSALSPESRQILSGLGFDPDKPQIGQQQNTPQQAREGETRAIPGVAGAEATFRGGTWVRTK